MGTSARAGRSAAELERWIDALEIVDDDLETLGDGILVDTILDLRSSQHELSAESRGVRSATSIALRSLASLLARAESRGTYETMFDFQADHAAAFAQEPLRMPGRVRQRYERRARAEGDHALFLFQEAVYATTDRLHGFLRLRLLRHALGRMAGREDVPSTERLGLPIRFEDDDGVCRSFIEPGCRKGKGCCPTVIAIAVRR